MTNRSKIGAFCAMCTVRSTAPARALGADGDVSPGGGIDDLQNRYYELNLVVLWPNYDCLTLMHHTGSSLDHLGVDQ